ncbi:periplasmic component of amino acid ABC-type transporter/signal transduction system [Xenococcus sp. PCC 7305]|uniref:amino acid ABC transporter substrate-binding protein n=1 Tax=Xenococcus sp. PCC 7305 TaxID=102125 RepID=UPI0002AC81DC|nr:amino acid ABC transporter substrate-binding protein [Xenococcus sp. PCC 7305]ELS04994.1 periplasmic component of amino acid ABC-type transporter/signal transduction system [Xenococcus sp. PCC 7305]
MAKKSTFNQKLSSLLITGLLALSIGGCGTSSDNNTEQSTTNSRLETVKNRGSLVCGVNGQLPGFSFVNEDGEYSGMDVDVCRAIASALFDDPNQVEFRDLSATERFTAVISGEVDLLSRNTTWTLNRDTAAGMEFAPTTFYDGQGIMITKASNIKKLEDLNEKSICALSGTTTEQNLADRMRKLGVTYEPVVFDDPDAVYAAYEQGRCEAVTSDRSQLTARRAVLANPQDHELLTVVLSKEPLGPLVTNGDSQWFDAVKWITYALMQAEEFGITSANLSSFDNTEDPQIQRFLGQVGNLGEDMGLPNDFAARIIKNVGNYGEIYEKNIGQPFGLERGLNNLWTNGGLLYAPPFR